MNGLGRRLTAALLAATTAIAMSGCVSRPDSGDGGGGEAGTIRFTFAPDPVWDYITAQGILAEMEKESGIKIEASSTWDEFGVFAGGHADIVSSASYEVPVIEEETGRDTVIIGKYNLDRSVSITAADNPAETLADLKPGMVLEGVVTNVAAFGAFVDVGVHQDGLVHVSAMAARYVSDPHEVVKSGQVVRVKVVDVDVERQRIGLSLRLGDETKPDRGPRKTDKPRGPQRKPQRTNDSRSRDTNRAGGSMAQALRDAGFGR